MRDCARDKLRKAIEEPVQNILIFVQGIGAGRVEQIALRRNQTGRIGKKATLTCGVFGNGDRMKTAWIEPTSC